jgi:hypothetical protein
MIDSASLASLLLAAGGAGVVHTLLGPDHYVPLLAVAAARGWSRARALAWTLVCGLVHCAAGAALAAVVLAATEAPAWLAGAEARRGDLAALLLLGTGVALLAGSLRRARRTAEPPRATPWLLGLVFLVGPCEWMVPALTAASAEHGVGGAAAAALVFSAATLLTMTLAVQAGMAVAPRVRSALPPRVLAGVAFAACGALMLLGL